MICWIQNYLFRHLRWLMAGLLLIIIMAFILMSGPLVETGGPRQAPNPLFGYDFNDPGTIAGLRTRSSLSNALQRRWQPLHEMMLERAAYLSLANTAGIRPPTQEQLQDYLKTRPIFSINGLFNPQAYQAFLDYLGGHPELSEEDLVPVLAEDYRIGQIRALLIGPGLSFPWEAEETLAAAQTKWSIEVAELDYETAQLPKPDINDTALEAYYSQHRERYRVPEQITLSAITFPGNHYRHTVSIEEPDQAVLRTYYQRNKAQFEPDETSPQDTEPGQLATLEIPTASEQNPPLSDSFLEQKEVVYQAWLQEQTIQQANLAAQYAAADFAAQLDAQSIQRNTPAFDQAVTDADAVPIAIPPFAPGNAPKDAWVPAPALERQAPALDDARYFSSEPIALEDGAAILIFENKSKPYIPSFAAVLERVRADYLADQRKQAFYDTGKRIREELAAAVASGQVFREAAEAEGLAVEVLDAFSAENPPQGNWRERLTQRSNDITPRVVAPLIASLGKGSLSDFADGKIIYIREKTPVALEPEAPALVAAMDRLNAITQQATHWSLLNELVALEQAKSSSRSNSSL